MTGATGAISDKQVERIVGILLRTGVVLAAVVVFSGGVLLLARHGHDSIDFRVFRGEPSDLRQIPAIIRQVPKLDPRLLIQFGLLLLIATPVVRVAFTVFAFAAERDWTYVMVTLIVLAFLLLGLTPWSP